MLYLLRESFFKNGGRSNNTLENHVPIKEMDKIIMIESNVNKNRQLNWDYLIFELKLKK